MTNKIKQAAQEIAAVAHGTGQLMRAQWNGDQQAVADAFTRTDARRAEIRSGKSK